MKPHPTSFFKVLLPAIVMALVQSALAVKIPTSIAGVNNTKLYSSNGTERGFTGQGRIDDLFNGDFGGQGVRVAENGVYLLVDFTSTIVTAGNSVYISEISVGHSGNSDYSILVSEDNSTWTTIASSGHTTGKTTYPVAQRAKYVKYVFDTAETYSDSLFELEVKGFETSVPKNVALKASDKGLAKMYKSDGSLCDNGTGGFGGGAGIGHFFDGNKKTNGGLWDGGGGTWMPHLGNGGWCELDFSSVVPDGYFVTKIAVYQCSDFKYSCYWSADGEAWSPVTDAVYVSKVGSDGGIYDVNETATRIRIVFDQTGGWTVNIAEIEVYGMDPDDVPCRHPSFTEWTPVENTATCLTPGIDERFCGVCSNRFTRLQDLPLGHDFTSHLLTRGTFARFGTGYISCSRCDWELQFPEPLDLMTNRVDGTRIGSVAVAGQVNFTDLTVTSTGNGADDDPNWGVNPNALYDGNWTFSWQTHWYSKTLNKDAHPYVDYEFGTEIDLCWVDISLPNENHQAVFYSVDEETGEETEIARLQVETDPEIDGSNGIVEKVRFDETPVSRLRIRQFNGDGTVRQMKISEIHPYGTVRGAGDVKVEKTTLFLFK